MQYLLFFLLLAVFFSATAQITVQFPTTRMVFQRNNQNSTVFYLSGSCPATLDRVEARLVPRNAGQGTATGWTTVEDYPVSGQFCGTVLGSGGWYNIEVRGIRNGAPEGDIAMVERIGIGEVFLIVGHSNAAGDESTSRPSFDDRVNSINFTSTHPGFYPYDQTADTTYLPVQYDQLCISCGIAPFGSFPWFWGQLGDSLAKHLNVPILFYSAAFGGSNMEQTYKAAYDIPFSHSFVNYSIRMPYVNIRNVFKKYAPITGLRGVLSAHGVNDGGSTTSDFYTYSVGVIAKSREDAQQHDFAWMVAISAYNNGPLQHIVDAQYQIINQTPSTYEGPNLNRIGNEGRGQVGREDYLHFNPTGQKLAAIYWSEAIENSPFITETTPMLPRPVRIYVPPTTVQSGQWTDPGVWCCGKLPKPSDVVYIKTGHAIDLSTPVQLKAFSAAGILNIKSAGEIQLQNSAYNLH